MDLISDDILTQILCSVGPTLCKPGTICGAMVRLVGKRWRKIIALRVAGRTTIAMAIHESWYFGNQPTMEFVGTHPYKCRAHMGECRRISDKDQAPVTGSANYTHSPMLTVENHTHYLWVHTAAPSVSPRYTSGGFSIAAFDTGRRLVHISPLDAVTFTCERDPSLYNVDHGRYPPSITNPPPISQTCLALQVGVQMSGAQVMSFMTKPHPEWAKPQGTQTGSQIGSRI
jgi:hypothetical protein